jgi:hypothetical protein
MKASEIKQAVCTQLGITEFEYDREVFESGVHFIEFVIGDFEYIKRVISYNNKYWAWWNNQFQLADMRLLNSGISKIEWYKSHSPAGTLVYPPEALFEETYAVLIDEIYKEVLC